MFGIGGHDDDDRLMLIMLIMLIMPIMPYNYFLAVENNHNWHLPVAKKQTRYLLLYLYGYIPYI